MKLIPLIAALIGLNVSVVFAKDLPREAHCEPQMDDACTINDQKVPKEQLGKYLPTLDVDTVEAMGGYCEYPICYGVNDNPIGIRSE